MPSNGLRLRAKVQFQIAHVFAKIRLRLGSGIAHSAFFVADALIDVLVQVFPSVAVLELADDAAVPKRVFLVFRAAKRWPIGGRGGEDDAVVGVQWLHKLSRITGRYQHHCRRAATTPVQSGIQLRRRQFAINGALHVHTIAVLAVRRHIEQTRVLFGVDIELAKAAA